MSVEMITNKIKELLYLTVEKISELNIGEFLQDNKEGLVLGIIGATTVFILKENKKIKKLLSSKIGNKSENILFNRVNNTMKKENLDFEEAKSFTITKELMEGLRVTKKDWFVNEKTFVVQGEQVSFVDKDIGLVSGVFIGLISSEVIGYDDIYVIKINRNNSIRQAPISLVDVETFYVYGRS